MNNKTKICLSLSNTFNLPDKEQIEKFHNHGFDGFFALYTTDKEMFELADFATKKGMIFQSLHAKHMDLDELWEESYPTQIMDSHKSTINCAGQMGVDRVIMHAYTLFTNSHSFDVGLKRIGELLELAEKNKVTICFENLQGPDYVDAILTEYANCKYAKMCYDSGHENCYDTFNLVNKHIDKIVALHINDNLGIRNKDKTLCWKDDLHLLPFDGNVDFDRVINIIKQANMQHELTFELKFAKDSIADKYRQMAFDDYLTLAKQRINKLISKL
jgi:sugar phosphate isomerase/epimerase